MDSTSFALPEGTIWLFLLDALAFLVSALTAAMLLMRRAIPPARLLAGPVLVVVSTWLATGIVYVDGDATTAAGVRDLATGFGATLVAGALFAVPTFAITAVALTIGGSRHRPWDVRGATVVFGLMAVAALLVATMVPYRGANDLYAYLRALTYLLLGGFVALAFRESASPSDDSTHGAGAAATLLPVMWMAVAESANWGFGHVFLPGAVAAVEPATCVEDWPNAVHWMLGRLWVELWYVGPAFGLALVVAVMGVVKRWRGGRDRPLAAVAVLAVLTSALLFGTARLDESTFLILSEFCPVVP